MNTITPSSAALSNRSFPETRTTHLMEAQEGSDKAREELARAYWQPLYFFALRVFKLDHYQAQDVVQEFFAVKFWHCLAMRQDRSKGKLRTFLLIAFKRSFLDYWRKSRALKHRPLEISSLDVEDMPEPAELDDEKSDSMFDRDWALNLWERATEALFQEWQQKCGGPMGAHDARENALTNDSERFAILSQHGLFARDPARLQDPDYPALAKSLNESETNARQIVSRARKDFRRLFREEVRQTLADGDNFDDEVAYVMNIILSGSRSLNAA